MFSAGDLTDPINPEYEGPDRPEGQSFEDLFSQALHDSVQDELHGPEISEDPS